MVRRSRICSLMGLEDMFERIYLFAVIALLVVGCIALLDWINSFNVGGQGQRAATSLVAASVAFGSVALALSRKRE